MSERSKLETLLGHRVVVTGAGGQLGRYLTPALSAAGVSVVALGHARGPGVNEVVDITDSIAIRESIRNAKPDAVIHAAAWTDVDGCERDPERAQAVNAIGSRNLAEAASDVGAYLLAVGTDFVFPGDGGAPYAEDADTRPISVYGESKLAGERFILAQDPRFAVARTAWVYGGAGKHFPRTVLTILRDRGSMEVVSDEFGNPTFAGDLAGALVRLLSTRGSGIFHLTNDGRASRFELARADAELAGFATEAVTSTTAAAFLSKYPLPATRPADSALTNRRAAALGITLRSWQAALAAYVPSLMVELEIDPRIGGEAST